MHVVQWSTHELSVLRDAAHLGPEAASAAIWALCGTRRTAGACQRQASRMGVSTAVRGVCPVCGFTGRRADFTPDGVCRACNAKALAERQRREVELVRSCADGSRRAEYERTLDEALRAYDMYRQQKHRLREEYGDRAAEIFEKVSSDLSNGRSDGKKSLEKDLQGTLF